MNGQNTNIISQRFVSIYISCIDSRLNHEGEPQKRDNGKVDHHKVTSIIFAELAAKNVDLAKFQKIIVDDQHHVHVLLAYPLGQESIDVDINSLTVSISSSLEAFYSSAQCHYISPHLDYESDNYSNRFVMTLMASTIGADFLTSVIALLVENNVLLCSINSLSADSAGMSKQKHTELPQAYELEVLIDDIDCIESLNHQLSELASQQSVDASIQSASILREQKRLACFDMDSTLIQAEVIDELAKEAGVGEQVAQITESAMRGELDFNQSFIKRMSLLEGLDESVLEKVAERLVLSDGVEVLFATLNRLGYKTAILSGGFDYFARILQKKLGIDYVYANELNIVEGKMTGKVIGDIINGDKKALLLQMIAKKENINLEQVIAVGDGANDLPMLAVAGLGVAYKAKPLVKASAKYTIDYVGLDGLLYMLGLSSWQINLLIK